MKLKLNRHQHRGPLGGHHYPSHGRTFRAETFDLLKAELTKFRLSNAIPVGNPDQDILLFYAKNFPWLVSPDVGAQEGQEDPNYKAWREWVSDVWKRAPTKFITTKEARLRWAACETCPFNTLFTWKETDESATVTKRAFVLRRGVTVPSFLNYCALHRTDLSVFTYIENAKEFSAKKDGEQPKACWV